MHRRIALPLIAGLLVLAGAITAVAVTDPWGLRSTSEPKAATTSPQPEPTSPASKDAEEVAAALAKLATDPASVASKDMKAKIDPKLAIPPGSTVEPKPHTWAPDGLGGGTMTVSLAVPGEAPEKYLALMDKEPDGWKISMTILLNDTPTPTAAK